MQVESTKKSPGTFSGRRKAALAMNSEPPVFARGQEIFLISVCIYDDSRPPFVQVRQPGM
jgi:hypothetical protein